MRPIKELSRTKISGGIYEITYQVAKLDNNKVIEGEWLENPYTKTVIDTDVLPLIKVKEMVLEAFMGRSFYRTSGGQLYINGTSANGVNFEGWIDLDTNKLKSFYPVSKFQYDY